MLSEEAAHDRDDGVRLDRGVNHIDTAADYGDSEFRLGPWLKHHRNDFFLATKIHGRTYEGAKESVDRSLERMQTDTIDLLQMHLLVDEEEWRTALADDGALSHLIRHRPGTDPVHGCYRPRALGRKDAQAESRSLPLFVGTPAVELAHVAERRVQRGSSTRRSASTATRLRRPRCAGSCRIAGSSRCSRDTRRHGSRARLARGMRFW